MMYFIGLTAISGILLVSIVGQRILAIRSGRVVALSEQSFHSLVQPKIDYLSFSFVMICREILKQISLHTLLALKKVTTFSHRVAHRWEKKFGHIIDMVHGKGASGKKGSASLFLVEIANFADDTKAQVKKR